MTPTRSCFELAAIFALVATTWLVAFGCFSSTDSPGRAALAHYRSSLDTDLGFLRVALRGDRVIVVQVASLGLCVVTAVLGDWTAWLFLPIVIFTPKLLIRLRVEQRVKRLEEEIEPWLNAIANSLKASPALADAIASTVSLVPAPMNEEIDVLMKEYELGTPFDAALDNLARRGRGRTLAAAVLALKVARNSGGNLPEMLETTAASLRELARLEGVVRSKTAEGKAQAVVIGIVPIPMVLFIHWSDPNFFEPLAATVLGNSIVAGAAALWVLAVLASSKILSVDV